MKSTNQNKLTGSGMPARSAGRPAIPVDRILAVALQLVDEEGAEALSMRTLAHRLGSGTATLYRHFDSRAQLVAHVVDRILGEIVIDANELSRMEWQEACVKAASAAFDAIRRRRNSAPLFAEQIPIGPNAMAQREMLIATLLAGGFAPPLAALAYATLAHHILGFAIQIPVEGSDFKANNARAAVRLRNLPRGKFPATAKVAHLLPVPLEEEFAFGLKLIVGGLGQLLADQQQN